MTADQIWALLMAIYHLVTSIVTFLVFIWFWKNYDWSGQKLTIYCKMPRCEWQITKTDHSKNGSERLFQRMKAEHNIHLNTAHVGALETE